MATTKERDEAVENIDKLVAVMNGFIKIVDKTEDLDKIRHDQLVAIAYTLCKATTTLMTIERRLITHDY